MSSTDPEAALLGMMLADVEDYEAARAGGIGPEHFESEEGRSIFLALSEAEKSGQRPSLPTVMRLHPELSETALALRGSAPIAQNVEAYIDEVKTLTRAREIRNELLELGRAIFARKPFSSREELEREVYRSVDRILSGQSETAGPRQIGEVISDLSQRMEEELALKDEGKSLRIKTGFDQLDKLTGGGFRPGSISTFGAPTGAGKTTLALNLFLNAALQGKHSLYFTVEMPDIDLVRKLLSRDGRINITRLGSVDLSNDEFDRFHASAKRLADLPAYFHDKTGASFEAVEATCRRFKRQGKLDFVVIDYIQQYGTAKKHKSIYERIVEVSERLKKLALELEIAVVSLAQLNREAEKTQKPMIYHLKESGQIANDSDLVVLIHREDDGSLSLYLGKNRHGRKDIGFPVKADLALNLFANANTNPRAYE